MIGVHIQSGVKVAERLCRFRSALLILAEAEGRPSRSVMGSEDRLNALASLRNSYEQFGGKGSAHTRERVQAGSEHSQKVYYAALQQALIEISNSVADFPYLSVLGLMLLEVKARSGVSIRNLESQRKLPAE